MEKIKVFVQKAFGPNFVAKKIEDYLQNESINKN